MLLEAAIAFAVIVALLAAGLVWIERAERRRRSRWWHDYFHGGGLVRALMQRWSGPKRLTHHPDEPA